MRRKSGYNPTNKELKHYRYLGDALLDVEWDIRHPIALKNSLPEAWNEICDKPTKAKKVVSIRLNTDTIKFFKALGPGYQEKINKVLEAFVEARLANMLDSRDGYGDINEGTWLTESLDELVARNKPKSETALIYEKLHKRLQEQGLLADDA